jgi:hypothetical protein
LPLFILLNLFFGWMFFKPGIWLSVEGILVLLFIINSYILIKKVSGFSSKRSDAIDVKGEVVDDKNKLLEDRF